MIGVKGLESLHGAPGGTPSDSLGSLQTLNHNPQTLNRLM